MGNNNIKKNKNKKKPSNPKGSVNNNNCIKKASDKQILDYSLAADNYHKNKKKRDYTLDYTTEYKPTGRGKWIKTVKTRNYPDYSIHPLTKEEYINYLVEFAYNKICNNITQSFKDKNLPVNMMAFPSLDKVKEDFLKQKDAYKHRKKNKNKCHNNKPYMAIVYHDPVNNWTEDYFKTVNMLTLKINDLSNKSLDCVTKITKAKNELKAHENGTYKQKRRLKLNLKFIQKTKDEIHKQIKYYQNLLSEYRNGHIIYVNGEFIKNGAHSIYSTGYFATKEDAENGMKNKFYECKYQVIDNKITQRYSTFIDIVKHTNNGIEFVSHAPVMDDIYGEKSQSVINFFNIS